MVLTIALTGCLPDGPGPVDEEKEPHFVQGKSRVNALDYAGAIEAFEQSLEINPHSAAAHFQLACLFDTKESVMDSAAAIYHYREFLRLTPKADNAEVIRQRIYSCKQQLAADVLPLPSAPATMKQIEDLTEKNRKLQEEVEKWRAHFATLPPTSATTPPPLTSLTPDDVSPQTTATPPAATTKTNTTTTGATASVGTSTNSAKPGAKPGPPKITPKSRTHIVATGETLASIARKHNISLPALQAANPGINPKKLHVGQTLNLPAA
jgi:LysM repeat protein